MSEEYDVAEATPDFWKKNAIKPSSCSRTVPKSTTSEIVAQLKVGSELWVYGSTMMPPEWCAWECLASTEEALAKNCKFKYGRVPYDCVAKKVPAVSVPVKYLMQYASEIFKGEGA